MTKLFLLLGSLGAFLGVGLGAFGAHALKAHLSPEFLAIFETGVRYQMYHSLALFGLGILSQLFPEWTRLKTVGILMAGGTLIFSGSLYILCLSGVKAWGAVTPIGGVLLLSSWLLLAWVAMRRL